MSVVGPRCSFSKAPDWLVYPTRSPKANRRCTRWVARDANLARLASGRGLVCAVGGFVAGLRLKFSESVIVSFVLP